MKARAKSNSTSSPPPTVAARRSSQASSAAATASAHSSPHLPDLILQSTTMEDFELLCKSAITPAYPNQKSSRFSVSSNPAIAAQPAASLGRGATAATTRATATARPSLSSPPSTTATTATAAAKTPAQATSTPQHTAIPMDESFAEANRSALTAQAHAIISEMKFQEDERNSERDRCVQDKFAQAATALKGSAASPGASPPQLQAEKRQSREVTPRRQASVPVDAAPEFSLYLNRTPDVPAFVRGLKEQKVVSDDCKETMLTPPPPPSQPPPADDDLPFIDESASDGSSPTANLSPLPPPPNNAALPIRIQDSAIVDSGPPANVEVEMKELSEAEAYPSHPQLNAARQQHPLTAQNPALHASRVDPNTQMQAATVIPALMPDVNNRFYHFAASPAHFRLIQAVPGETQGAEALQRGGKRRVGGKERRERLAKKNVKEEMLAETMEGHRGNEAVESLLSYIEGTHQTGPAHPATKQGKKPSRAPMEAAAAGNGQGQSHAKPPKGGKAGRVKGGGKLASTSPASSATPSLDSEEEEEEEERGEEGAPTKANLSPPSPQRPRLIDTTDMRLFASDSMVQQLLKATAEPSSPFSLEEQDFKVVETKKKAKKPPTAQPWKAASTGGGAPRAAALAARPQHSKPSSPPPTTASKAASSVSAPLSPSGRSQPSAMAAEAPAPSSAQDWPLIQKRRQSVDHLPKAASSTAPTPPSSSASSTAGPAREAGAGTSWASVASRPHGQTASLHTSRASSPNRRSASATGPGNASSPDLALISPPPSSEPLSTPPLSNEAAALLSPPLPPHPEGAETKSWATVAAAQRPTAVVKPQPPQPQEHLPTESESPVAGEEVVEEATPATATLPTSQTPPPDEPTQTGAPETELSSLGGGGSSVGGGLVEFAFPTSDSNSSDLSDDGHSGITFGDFHNEFPAPVLPVHNSITAQGLSFGDFGAVPATESPAVDLMDEPKLPAPARAKKVPVDESDFARELRQQFELSTQSSEVVVVYSGGQILERV